MAAGIACAGCFNPLPSPKQGETSRVPNHRSPSAVSIRSPHQSKGRRRRWARSLRTPSVSIRSPHQSKGRQGEGAGKIDPIVFQSAPLTKARGDPHGRGRYRKSGWVSIRSPHQSKGRRVRIDAPGEHRVVSIRSPHQSKGRPAS